MTRYTREQIGGGGGERFNQRSDSRFYPIRYNCQLQRLGLTAHDSLLHTLGRAAKLLVNVLAPPPTTGLPFRKDDTSLVVFPQDCARVLRPTIS